MSMGMVYINITDDDRLFKQVNYFSPPILLLFFVRSGMSFDLKALVGASGSVGTAPLLVRGLFHRRPGHLDLCGRRAHPD